jgi:multicomponent Na+:H+ antiporter subunit D
VVTSLLTLYAVTRVWSLAFWRTPQGDRPDTADEADAAESADPVDAGHRLPPLMVAATLALVVIGVGLTAVAGPLFDISADAAGQLLERQPYVRAVFPDGAP